MSVGEYRTVKPLRISMMVWLVAGGMSGACRRGESNPANPASGDAATGERPARLVYTDNLHVADSAVNAFINRAMAVCAAGVYSDFRLLWSAGADPMPRDEFEQGWQAVQQIRILAVEKALLEADTEPPVAESPVVYAIYAEVALDPMHPAARTKPNRWVALMLVREQEQWRLARAPKRMRTWIQTQAERAAAISPELVTKPSVDQDGEP